MWALKNLISCKQIKAPLNLATDQLVTACLTAIDFKML